MSSKQARGTKRTCQNPACGVRFYDLNRDPIICPECHKEYVIASAPAGYAVAADKGVRKPRKEEFPGVEAAGPEAAAAIEGDEALAEVVEAGEEPIAPDAEEVFIEEEEEDGGDVVDILPTGEGEEGESEP